MIDATRPVGHPYYGGTKTEGAPAGALVPGGFACHVCADTRPPLRTVGHTYTSDREGGRLGWPLVVCARHAGGRR